MACGAVISAPAVVLSVIMGIDVTTTCLLIGVPTAIYTMFGGVQAVTWTDVKQMFLIVFGLARGVRRRCSSACPTRSAWPMRCDIAGSTGRLQTFDFRFDLTDRYTFWSGTIAALFLFMSYFGTDQSQVQRYLTARSVDEARVSLFMSAYWKIPLQALVLLIGVFMFVFYLFTPPPMLFNPAHDEQVRESARAARISGARTAVRHGGRSSAGRRPSRSPASRRSSDAGGAGVRRSRRSRAGTTKSRPFAARPSRWCKDVSGDASYNDVNFVFPTWVTTQLPVGLVGLIIAAIFAAAMSTISAELAALSTATVIDFYRRWIRPRGRRTGIS